MKGSSWRAAALLLVLAAPLSAQTHDRDIIRTATDSIVADALKGGMAAGMSVAVVRGRDTIVMKGYGKADLEFDVPTPPRAIYEIGSVTKQFTASAILQLRDAGKLSLDDTITKFLPSLNLQGNVVTIRHLLDHTSGIKSYTELPEFRTLRMQKLARDTLVKLVGNKPFDFKPGDALIYNNSGYFLLGLIIEKASGMAYDAYVKQHLFDRAGMPDSRYCSESAIVKNRAHGYDVVARGLVRAAYLDHTWPFAAGSLCSTVGDLVAWNFALHGGRVLSPAAYRDLTTARTLNDGTPLRYSKGLFVDSALGHAVITHGGGINGFLSTVDYFPQDSTVVVVLANTAGPVSPGTVARAIETVMFGQWTPRSQAFTGNVADYVGEFRGPGRGSELRLTVAADSAGKGLTARTGNAPPAPLELIEKEAFRLRAAGARLTFVRQQQRVVAVRADFGSVVTLLKKQP